MATHNYAEVERLEDKPVNGTVLKIADVIEQELALVTEVTA